MKILAIPGSNSSKSINKKLVHWASGQIKGAEVKLLDLNDFEMPLYSADREQNDGIPEVARNFVDLIEQSDGILLSLAEHNGAYSSAFKNLIDWSSRHKQKVWSDKPMFLMATSPGGRGGATVLALAENYFPYMGADIKGTFSLPKFSSHFEDGLDAEFETKFNEAFSSFRQLGEA